MTAIAGFDIPQRRLHPAEAHLDQRPDVVVRLHRDHTPRPRSIGGVSSASAYPAPVDLDQVTRAVQALVEALAPGMLAEVTMVERAAGAPAAGHPAVGHPAGQDPGAVSPDVVGDEFIRLDRRSRTLLIDGEPVSLTKREFELLAHLAQHRGVAMSRRELMNAVWHERYLPGDRTVDVHVRRVRVKLGPHAGRLNTLRGYGYRFDSA